MLGLIAGGVVAAVAVPLLLLVGPQTWVLVVIGILVVAGSLACAMMSHHIFTKGNVDLNLYGVVVIMTGAAVYHLLAEDAGPADPPSSTEPPAAPGPDQP